MKTFMQFLTDKKNEAVTQTDPMTIRGVVSQMVGGPSATATNLPQIAAAMSSKDLPFAVAIAKDPRTEKARAVADAAQKKTAPNQQPTPLSPNALGVPAAVPLA